jgi:hypothetical protein
MIGVWVLDLWNGLDQEGMLMLIAGCAAFALDVAVDELDLIGSECDGVGDVGG